jgi:hypothetical protein
VEAATISIKVDAVVGYDMDSRLEASNGTERNRWRTGSSSSWWGSASGSHDIATQYHVKKIHK